MRPNRTPVEEIQDAVEVASFSLAAPALLDMELGRHTRRGLRPDCDCEYCVAKRIGTAEVEQVCRSISWGTIPSTSNREIRAYGSCNPIYEDAWVLKQNARHYARKRVRQTLFELRNKPE